MINKRNIALFLSLSVLVVIGASFWASGHPDGLEWVAEKMGFMGMAVETNFLMADYTIPFITNETISTMIAGFAGILITMVVFLGAIFIRRSLRRLLRVNSP